MKARGLAAIPRKIGKALDKLPDARLELDRPDHADLETEVAQGGTQVVLDGNGLDNQREAHCCPDYACGSPLCATVIS